MKRLSSFTLALLAAAFLALAASPQANAAQQVQPIDHLDADQGVVDLTDSAYLEAANGGAFVHAYSTGADRTNGIDRTETVDATTTEATEGAYAPFPRARLAGNGIEGNEDSPSVNAFESGSMTASPIIFGDVIKLDRTPITAPNSEYRYAALETSDVLNLGNFRTDRLTTVQRL